MPPKTNPSETPNSKTAVPKPPKLRPPTGMTVVVLLLLGAAVFGYRTAADGAMKNVSVLFGLSLSFWIKLTIGFNT